MRNIIIITLSVIAIVTFIFAVKVALDVKNYSPIARNIESVDCAFEWAKPGDKNYNSDDRFNGIYKTCTTHYSDHTNSIRRDLTHEFRDGSYNPFKEPTELQKWYEKNYDKMITVKEY